jgi:hypothetical protein
VPAQNAPAIWKPDGRVKHIRLVSGGAVMFEIGQLFISG